MKSFFSNMMVYLALLLGLVSGAPRAFTSFRRLATPIAGRINPSASRLAATSQFNKNLLAIRPLTTEAKAEKILREVNQEAVKQAAPAVQEVAKPAGRPWGKYFSVFILGVWVGNTALPYLKSLIPNKEQIAAEQAALEKATGEKAPPKDIGEYWGDMTGDIIGHVAEKVVENAIEPAVGKDAADLVGDVVDKYVSEPVGNFAEHVIDTFDLEDNLPDPNAKPKSTDAKGDKKVTPTKPHAHGDVLIGTGTLGKQLHDQSPKEKIAPRS